MPSADVPSLPPWLTRQYDYAQGFRGIGRGLAQGQENALRQTQIQEAQLAMQQQAQIAASRRQGMAGYQKSLQQLMTQDPTMSPEDAAVKAYVQNAHLLDPLNFQKTLMSEENYQSRLKLATEANKLRAKTAADLLASKAAALAQQAKLAGDREKRIRDLADKKNQQFDASLLEKQAEETGRNIRAEKKLAPAGAAVEPTVKEVNGVKMVYVPGSKQVHVIKPEASKSEFMTKNLPTLLKDGKSAEEAVQTLDKAWGLLNQAAPTSGGQKIRSYDPNTRELSPP